MGKKLRKQAMQLGLTNLPKYTFFGHPRKLKMKFPQYKPDLAYTVENWMKNLDPTTTAEKSGGGRNNTFYYLSSTLGVYVEIVDKMAGLIVPNPGNHVSQIDIYTNNADYIRTIVGIINIIWDDGILNHLDFQKLEKKYKVSREDIINAWSAFL